MINNLKIKKAVKNFLKGFNEPLPIPFDFNIIQKTYPNITIRKYSEFQNKYKMTIKDISNYFGSEDAVCDYSAEKNKYIISYNDFDIKKINCFRYRFSIAHELGHIFLCHLDNNRTRIFRNKISDAEYKELEDEADQFAAYILCPHSALLNMDIKNQNLLSSICHLSKYASEKRHSEYIEWLNNRNIKETNQANIKLDWFDLLLSRKFIAKRYCSKCKKIMDVDNYCKYCGDRLDLVPNKVEENNLEYNKIELNENHKAIKCPVCENENVVDGEYCQICGTHIVNKCTSDFCNKFLDGDARYCSKCGSETTFFINKLLAAHDGSYFNSIDDEIPF